MGFEWLNDYDEGWRRRSPQQVLEAVKAVERDGGWERVFRDGIPRWAHKVRNFFNREPQGLTLLNKNQGVRGLMNIGLKSFDLIVVGPAEAFALSGDVYRDEYNVHWFQMGAGGTIFHFKNVRNMKMEAAAQQYMGQVRTPVFKLVSPDRTGGSRETIIRNFQPRTGFNPTDMIGSVPGLAGASVIGEEGHYEVVVSRIEVIPKMFQGSYNYAETAVSGIDLHTKFDIEPHKKDPVYRSPGNRFSDLSSRIFPLLTKEEMNWRS